MLLRDFMKLSRCNSVEAISILSNNIVIDACSFHYYEKVVAPYL
jgi:hypothetical protein